ncbi:TetR/AcrR family transcriptional regulator [Mycolicibacterium goodii]|uniref:TetR/AcrR family transcriptional regulator n=1 Tax=Mycolicibacterium goodii TaxID=134601 RepID=UPI001BDD2FC6|nr:TetR/AcrR family transcriptional regulator [Mycolicibacterium goodii]MBU8812491.1 TetR/AcrR family transcriptional regulator [Mycolicibacterium goodii]ULN44910.1 TetR/AcrR family transcriptional regulator [Mycolicibacterium goodii]
MPRWDPDAVGRLQLAALELFGQQGFAGTTVSEIARRAGLTERTFFNHFDAKKDVLFGPRTQRHQEIVLREILASDDASRPIDVVVHGLQIAAEELFEGLREASIRRRQIIDENPELLERDLGKRTALIAAIAEALRGRGLDADAAILTARIGAVIEQSAEERWMRSPKPLSLQHHLSDVFASLEGILQARGPDWTA